MRTVRLWSSGSEQLHPAAPYPGVTLFAPKECTLSSVVLELAEKSRRGKNSPSLSTAAYRKAAATTRRWGWSRWQKVVLLSRSGAEWV